MNDQKMILFHATTLILENNFYIAFSSFNELFKILWTIPVNSCEFERSCSALQRLKTYLRNSRDNFPNNDGKILYSLV